MTKMKWPERTIREKTNHFKPTFYMKKTIIIIAAALFGCTMLGAQEKGEMTVGGTIGFSGGSSAYPVSSDGFSQTTGVSALPSLTDLPHSQQPMMTANGSRTKQIL